MYLNNISSCYLTTGISTDKESQEYLNITTVQLVCTNQHINEYNLVPRTFKIHSNLKRILTPAEHLKQCLSGKVELTDGGAGSDINEGVERDVTPFRDYCE